uniref:Uncharacterized protein n=1 Tax=Rhizophora mucronata TaxID=61149 RepID=A0A2P2R400_RHIMU
MLSCKIRSFMYWAVVCWLG